MNKFTEKVIKAETNTLKEFAALLMDSPETIDETLEAVMNELEDRMSTENYVAFCDTL